MLLLTFPLVKYNEVALLCMSGGTWALSCPLLQPLAPFSRCQNSSLPPPPMQLVWNEIDQTNISKMLKCLVGCRGGAGALFPQKRTRIRKIKATTTTISTRRDTLGSPSFKKLPSASAVALQEARAIVAPLLALACLGAGIYQGVKDWRVREKREEQSSCPVTGALCSALQEGETKAPELNSHHGSGRHTAAGIGWILLRIGT